MKHLILVAILATSAACAPVKVTVDDVHVVHEVNVGNLTDYFKALCVAQNPAYNDVQVKTCADALVGEFLSSFGGH